MTRLILFVDDEKPILRAMKRLFYKSGFEVLLANSGDEALELLENNDVGMIISDMRMPEMDGYTLLTKVKALYPEIIRIALSGYTEKHIVLKALRNNLVKIYLFKPWNNDEIIQTMTSLFELEKQLKDKNLLDLINNLSDIPTIPNMYHEISRMVESDAAIKDVALLIEKDQAITARILRIANSAYFGQKTGDIQSAISFIGLENVKNIILTNAVYSIGGVSKERMEKEWKHSGLTNKILNYIYKEWLNERLPIEEKSAGLLANIGKVVLLVNMSDIYEPELMGENPYECTECEINKIGVSHQQIGGYLLNWWELPLPLVECAFFHHNPTNEGIVNKTLVKVVHLAHHYAWVHMDVSDQEGLELGVFNDLGINQEALENGLDVFLKSDN